MLYEDVLQVSRVALWRKMNLFRSELEEDMLQKRLLSVDEVVEICAFFDISENFVLERLEKLGKI